VHIPSYHWADPVKNNEVGRACGTNGRGEKSVQRFGGKAQRKETTRKIQGVDGKMGSEWILGRSAGGVDWIRLAQDRGRW
jgi:hypothetical protein